LKRKSSYSSAARFDRRVYLARDVLVDGSVARIRGFVTVKRGHEVVDSTEEGMVRLDAFLRPVEVLLG